MQLVKSKLGSKVKVSRMMLSTPLCSTSSSSLMFDAILLFDAIWTEQVR